MYICCDWAVFIVLIVAVFLLQVRKDSQVNLAQATIKSDGGIPGKTNLMKSQPPKEIVITISPILTLKNMLPVGIDVSLFDFSQDRK